MRMLRRVAVIPAIRSDFRVGFAPDSEAFGLIFWAVSL